MGAGLAPKKKGALRFSLDIRRGSDFEASHREDKGLSSSGQVVSAPEHRHNVSLDFTRIELGAQYTFADNWDLWTRVPYDTKQRTASLDLLLLPRLPSKRTCSETSTFTIEARRWKDSAISIYSWLTT